MVPRQLEECHLTLDQQYDLMHWSQVLQHSWISVVLKNLDRQRPNHTEMKTNVKHFPIWSLALLLEQISSNPVQCRIFIASKRHVWRGRYLIPDNEYTCKEYSICTRRFMFSIAVTEPLPFQTLNFLRIYVTCCLCLTDSISAILILYWYIRHLSDRPRISREYLWPLPTLALTMVVIPLERSTAIASWQFPMAISRRLRTLRCKALGWESKKMLSSMRHSRRVFCCIRTQAITAQHIYSHPTSTIFSGQTVSLAWHGRDRKTHSFATMLCQVPSPYSAFLELFRQVTPPLTQPPLPPSRRTRWPPRPCLIPLLAPYLYLFKGCAEATWQGTLNSPGFSHLNWVLTAAPIFHESRWPLMSSRPHSKLSLGIFNWRMRSSGGSLSTWTRWSDPAEVLYVELCSWKYRSLYQSHQCQCKIIFFMRDHLLRWTLNILLISSARWPKGLACPVSGSTWSWFCQVFRVEIKGTNNLLVLLCLQPSACSWTMRLTLYGVFSCTSIWGLDYYISSSLHD